MSYVEIQVVSLVCSIEAAPESHRTPRNEIIMPPTLFSNRTFGLCALLVALLFLLPFNYVYGEQEESSASESVRVVTWNIQWFPGRTPGASENAQLAHRAEVREYLPGLKPDILLLQEIRDDEAAQFLVDSVEGLEMHVATDFQRPQAHLSQQIVIASRFPALAAHMEVFTDIYHDPQTEPYRGFAFTALEAPDGGVWLVYGVHLKSNRGEAEYNIATRQESARQILEHIEAMVDLYTDQGPIGIIIGGDFNLLLEREHMAHEETLNIFLDEGFHWSWAGVPFEERVTWPAAGPFPDACFDHILTRHLPRETAEVLYKPESELSDHRPVLLKLEIE